MLRTSRMARRPTILGLLGILAAFALSLWGCGSYPTSYTDPNASITTTQTPTALIGAATLKQWMDEGKVNSTDPQARDRVVIVDVATTATYNVSHIPNAVLLNQSTQSQQSRLEAVAVLTSEPPDGPSMDAMISQLGIDGNTTIVFSVSTGQNYMQACRMYYTFRYWGFPKARLKVLQGGDDGWVAGGYSLTAAVPSVRASNYSVKSNFTSGNYSSFSMRSPIGEMIDVVDKVNAGTLSVTSATGISILDERGGVDPVVGPYIMNAGVDDWNQYYVAGKASYFKPTADIVARLATFGVTAQKAMNYVYCASGHRASTTFFILDGILGWPVRLYDGSSGQWLAYRAGNVAATWEVDVNSPGTTTKRTAGTGALTGTLTLDPVSNVILTTITDPRANQIANTDKAYVSSGGGGGGSTGGGGGTGSPSGC